MHITTTSFVNPTPLPLYFWLLLRVCFFQQRWLTRKIITFKREILDFTKQQIYWAADPILSTMNYETPAQNCNCITVKFIITLGLYTEIHIIYSKFSSWLNTQTAGTLSFPFCCVSAMWWVHLFLSVIYDAPTISRNHIHRSTFFQIRGWMAYVTMIESGQGWEY